MQLTSYPSSESRLRNIGRFVAAAGPAAGAIGLLALLGWWLDVPQLRSTHPALVPMNPVAASCFILAGLALWLFRSEPVGPRSRAAGLLCAGTVTAVAAVKLGSLALGRGAGVDQLLFPAKLEALAAVGHDRMAPNSAAAFLFLGAALLALGAGGRRRAWTSQLLVVPCLLIVVLALIGYAYGARSFYGLDGQKPMALNTAVAFLVLAAGTLSARPATGVPAAWVRDDGGGYLLRRLLPVALLVLLGLGWLALRGEDLGLLENRPGMSLVVAFDILILVTIAVLSARSISRAESVRQAVATALKSAHDGLEQEVTVRTRDLTDSNEKLTAEVAERRRIEASLIKLSRAVEQTADMVVITDSTGQIEYVNPAFSRVTGYSSEEVVGRNPRILQSGRHDAAFYRDLWETIKAGRVWRGEMVNRRRDGSCYPEAMTVSPILSEDGQITHFVALKQDITEQRRRDEALRRSLSILEATLESTADGILVVDRAGSIVRFNQQFARMWRIPAEILASKDDRLALTYVVDQLREPERFMDKVRELYARPDAESFDVLEFKDDRCFERYSRPQRVDDEIVGRVWSFRDVTEHRASEEALRRTQFAIDHSAESCLWARQDGRLAYVNEAACKSLGYTREELLKLGVSDINPDLPPQAWAEKWNRTNSGESATFESRHRRKDGSVFPVEISVNHVVFGETRYGCAFARDISARRTLEEQFRQAQKMEAVGRLAGGVAHDFNNILSVILGYGQLLLRDLAPRDPAREKVEQIQKAGERAAGLTRQLLAFSRKQVLEPKVLDLGVVASDFESMLRRLVGEDIELTIVRSPELGQVMADPGQIEQILMNLVVNARDAMPAGGRLTIETTNIDLDRDYASSHGPVEPGPYVMLAVSDTGCGMDQDIRSHIFEPFFSTKASGKGTGLGLATVYGVVKQSGGYIWVYSEPGRGTTFKIYLPRIDRITSPAEGTFAATMPAGRGETILLVEDDEAVRHLIRELLETSGYGVMAAGSGPEALSLVDAYDGPIELLVTDVIMPGMTGPELATTLTARRPRMKVLFVSGYTDDAMARHGVLEPGIALLSKPFSREDLARRVAKLLRESRQEGLGQAA